MSTHGFREARMFLDQVMGVFANDELGVQAHPLPVGGKAGEDTGRNGNAVPHAAIRLDDDGPFAAPPAEVLHRQRANIDRLRGDDLIDGWVTLVGHD